MYVRDGDTARRAESQDKGKEVLSLVFEFDLSRGSYATVLIAEVMGKNNLSL